MCSKIISRPSCLCLYSLFKSVIDCDASETLRKLLNAQERRPFLFSKCFCLLLRESWAGFIFVRTFFVQKRIMFSFSRAHSHALTNATRFPRTEQTFASARSCRVISWASFLHENECAKWYQNSWHWQNLQRKRGIFVIVCGICWGVDKSQISKWHSLV